MNQHDQILDPDGENQAVRCFLLHYQNPGVSIGALRNALRRSGFDGCWPDWVNGRETSESITKAGAQLWIRHLFSLEQTLSHVNKTPKNEHDSDDVLNKSGNVDMMREALESAIEVAEHIAKKTDDQSMWTHVSMLKEALAAEPAPLVRLTDEEVIAAWDGHIIPVFGKTGINVIVFAYAIMDAMERVNRRQLDQTPKTPSE